MGGEASRESKLNQARDFFAKAARDASEAGLTPDEVLVFTFTDKETKPETALLLEQGQPLRFGQDNEKGIRIDGLQPRIVHLENDGFSPEDLWIHDEKDMYKAQILVRFFDDPRTNPEALPRPFGVFYETDRPCYEEQLFAQLEQAQSQQGTGDLNQLLSGKLTWKIE